MRRTTRAVTRTTWVSTGLAVVAAGLVIATSAAGHAAGKAAVSGQSGLDPSDFTKPKPNAYFPLTPGLVLRYRGSDGPGKFREKVTVTHKKKTVDGIKATVVHDVLRRADGTIAEGTHDWYADDNSGNVWYVGEDTATYDRQGNVKSREGSWQAGVEGATAGLIMPVDPKPTDAYRQEYWRGQAEDQAWIVQSQATVKVPLGTYHHVVRSYEWSRLEKGNVSVKFYAPGLGIVSEHDISGGSETFKLVSVTRP